MILKLLHEQQQFSKFDINFYIVPNYWFYISIYDKYFN
jgi:hypothetical protein